MPNDLLQPSLGKNWQANSIYSVRSMVLVAFFGGPIAIALYAYQNSKLLNRADRDQLLFAGFAAVCLVIYGFVAYYATIPEPPEWLLERRNFRYVMRGVALLFMGFVYLRWKDLFKAFEVSGHELQNPWKMALIAIGSGWLVPIVAVTIGVILAKS